MKAVLYAFFIFSLAFLGCAETKTAQQTGIEQGITGYILQEKGNRMPSPDRPNNPPKGLKTLVFIYPVTSLGQLTALSAPGQFQTIKTPPLATITTDTTGYFSVALPAGAYSIFVKFGDAIYANWFNEKNQVSPVEVVEHKIATVKFTVAAGATF